MWYKPETGRCWSIHAECASWRPDTKKSQSMSLKGSRAGTLCLITRSYYRGRSHQGPWAQESAPAPACTPGQDHLAVLAMQSLRSLVAKGRQLVLKRWVFGGEFDQPACSRADERF